MKKLLLIIVSFVVMFGLTACEDLCVGPECTTGENEECENSTVDTSGIIPFTHLNGHGDESAKQAYILYEFAARDYTKYQIAYLACTCREANVNFWSVALVTIGNENNEIQEISYRDNGDANHPYSVGFWGDSNPTPPGVTLEQFETFFFPFLIGKTYADLEGISYFSNDSYFEVSPNTTTIENTPIDFDSNPDTPDVGIIDAFAGSSVSTNNIIRVFKELLLYHENK